MAKRSLLDVLADLAEGHLEDRERSVFYPKELPKMDLLKTGPNTSTGTQDKNAKPIPPLKGYKPVGRGNGMKGLNDRS